MEKFSYLDFLRDIGKNVTVNVMLAKDSIKGRIERPDSGISYTEFSYMLLQAYDFVHLARNENCFLQAGGSDQWGNITAGIDLGRRMLAQELFGLTCPLLLTSDGKKMGKSERGAIWLDPKRTSPYAFYQYWINVSDSDVLMCLRFLTELSEEEIQQVQASLQNEPHLRVAQKTLAQWLTKFVHGDAGLQTALRATEILFGAAIESLDDSQLLDIFADVPSGQVARSHLEAGLSVLDAFVLAGLAKSKGEARRAIEQGAANVNNRRVESVERILTLQDLASETVLVLRSGKKNYALLRLV
jgi:tyrosyl-tRNA synthetase